MCIARGFNLQSSELATVKNGTRLQICHGTSERLTIVLLCRVCAEEAVRRTIRCPIPEGHVNDFDFYQSLSLQCSTMRFILTT